MAKTKRSKLWKNLFGAFAIYLSFNIFHSATAYVGLTKIESSCSYEMTRRSSSWEKFWGERALELWNRFPDKEGLAIALIKGNTLTGLKKAYVNEKMGPPQTSDLKSKYWNYFLDGGVSEYGAQFNVFFDENDVVVGTSILRFP